MVDISMTYLGNTTDEYLLAITIFVVVAAAFKFLQWLLLRRLEDLAKKTKTDLDDTLIRIVRSLKPAFYYFLAFYIAVQSLAFLETLEQIINGVLLAWLAYQAVMALHVLIDYTIEKRSEKEGIDGQGAFKFLSNFVKWALWIVAALMVLANLGINVTSLIAGLGIGGIAVALALQNILSDLFSSFAIYLDKPFEVGDFIQAGDSTGTVEKIGIKTTRIRSITGEEIVISNKELTTARIKNYKRIKERRSLFTIGVTYETPVEKLRAIPEMIKEIIEAEKSTKFDRVNFKTFADSSLNYDVSYYVKTTDYKEFRDIEEGISLNIIEKFQKEKIDFAYPTRTIYSAK
ncbi:MAG: mechanosensitive ion channel family protein [Parcubacteria group bacterium]|nr:mechanosensitive ion channel family protein [Parcubacteria group bacterium]